jgi:acyl-CoA thioesterase-2
MANHALIRVLELLDLEDLELNVFRGVSPDVERQRVFGGQVLGQALVAAGRTVEADRQVHSLHAYFLRPGDPRIPILYEVDRSRDGRSFTTRRVVAIQHGRQIFHMSASFQVNEDGFEHHTPMPEVTPPEELPSWIELLQPWKDKLPWLKDEHAIEFRYPDPSGLTASGESGTGTHRIWFCTTGPVPGEPLLQAALAAYASDMILLDTAVRPHRLSPFDESVQMATIDHAMWFHAPFRVDEWLLFDLTSPSASGARGLAFGGLYRRDGTLACSLAQEGLIRRRTR